jgi:glycosyltransferase involved in cell wall biosynthesis
VPSTAGNGGNVASAPDPLVDVGIAAFRRPDYLEQAVESVLAQTLDRWRLLISEDGPVENGASVGDKHGYLCDARIEYRALASNVGIVGNKNGLLRAARAPYVAILDDDDCWDPDFLERRTAFLKMHPECGFVFSGYVEIDEFGETIRESEHVGPEGVMAGAEVAGRLMLGNFIRTPTVVVRRTAYEAVGMSFDDWFPTIYDWEMWIRLALRFPVGYLATRDVGYRVHLEQETFRNRNAEEVLRLLEHVEADAARNALELPLTDSESRRCRAFWNVSAALDALERGEQRTALDRLLRALRLAPRELLDRRAVAAAGGIVLGRRAGRFISGPVRTFVRRRGRQRRSSGVPA